MPFKIVARNGALVTYPIANGTASIYKKHSAPIVHDVSPCVMCMSIDHSCSCLSNFYVGVVIPTNDLANAQCGSDELMSQSVPCPEVVQNQE